VSPPEDKFTPWAFRQSLRGMKLTGAQYRIAIELAEHTKSGKPAVWPSIATLARHCALNTRTVERALGELANLGIITKGEGKSTRILAVQPPVHRPVASGPQTGHTPVHRPDEYLKYENKGPKATDDQHRVGEVTGSPGGDQSVVEFKEGYPISAPSTLTVDPLDSTGSPEKLPPAVHDTCPECGGAVTGDGEYHGAHCSLSHCSGCSNSDPWSGAQHIPDCPHHS
jgi:hypothetical protein